MQNELTYLLSSFKDNPERLFQGYCFDKENFVFGQEGADKYFEETGREIALGEDGCYVTAKRVDNGYEIGSDYSGYKKILYFSDEKTGSWAVSNSLTKIVEHLAENSIRVTPRIQSIMAMHIGISVFQQPVTFDTIANEIKILPLNSILKIGAKKLEIRKIHNLDFLETDYDNVLRNFVAMWSSRIATLLSCKDFFIQQGLTGGLDSRSVFSLSNIANKTQKVNADYRLISSLTRGDDIDIKIAGKITNHYGYELNDKSPPTIYNPKKLNAQEKYLIWKDTSLGLYHPIYFPIFESDYRKVSIGGHGGENHRIFYAKNPKIYDYDSFIASLSKSFKDTQLKNKFASDLNNTLSTMQEMDMHGSAIDPLILHYKHFRNRFHSGLFPQYRVVFSPLSSRYLTNISTGENSKKLENSQVLYDLINLTDGLLEIPFDNLKKFPTQKNLEQLTKITGNVPIKVGRVFSSNNLFKESVSLHTKKSPFIYLKEDFDKACDTELVKKLWGKDFINKASNSLDKAVKEGKFGHATDGINVSTIIATGLFEL
ncbi:hypothetical protein [Psychrobacter sp. NPDC078631]|uniref:hypothetical protein n=1 Tax=Psychrobacter sp. NPDC078631 TaxID=3390666 RepID=UPI003CFDC97B